MQPAHPARYSAFGLEIHSEILLPELPFEGAREGDPDVSIRFASFSEPAPATPGGARFHAEDGVGYLNVPRVGHFRISEGRRIDIDPNPSANEQQLRLFLLGSAFGVLCHQRGLLPLHANAIVVNGSAFAFAGRSGIGKSTLAAHFHSLGYPILSDDVCVLSFDEEGRPLAWPGLPRLRLWRDAVETFGHDVETLQRAFHGRDKFHVPIAAAPENRAYPLARLYVLSDLLPEEPREIRRLTAHHAVRAAMANTYRTQYIAPLGLHTDHFNQAINVARFCEVFEAPRERGFDVFASEAARFEAHVLDLAIG